MYNDATVYMASGHEVVSRPYHESVTECGVAACERIAPARTEISRILPVCSHTAFFCSRGGTPLPALVRRAFTPGLQLLRSRVAMQTVLSARCTTMLVARRVRPSSRPPQRVSLLESRPKRHRALSAA